MKFNAKTYLKLLMVVGLIAVVGGTAGTFASFNAETTNAGNTFATGTLLLSNTVTTGTACYSNEAAGNTNGSCSAVINTSTMTPGNSTDSYLTIKNEGTLDTGNLKLYIPANQTGSVSCANTTTGTFPGTDALAHTGDVCANVKFSVEEDGTANGTATACVIGTATDPGNDESCDPAQGVSFATFYGAHNTSANAQSLGSGLTAGSSKFYKIYVYLPDEDNTFQGRSAAFDLTWHVDQL
jgi:predicted ribosomally synthesized peptide with SipW-like signal peptide